jgi:hypothetical protein
MLTTSLLGGTVVYGALLTVAVAVLCLFWGVRTFRREAV